MLQYLNLTTTNPSFNLAAEEFVFESLPKDRSYFMLWQNDRAVIIGKYQNTLAEINLPYIEANGIRVVRRLSGGGAVYHDLGNLNYSFIADAKESERLDLRLFCEPVLRTLSSFGVKAELKGRNDMTVDGQKFSGNAQMIRHGRVLHHGTILFDSDLEAVTLALHVDEAKICAKGIRSVRSRVTNLKPFFDPPITLPAFRQALLKEVLRAEPGEERCFTKAELTVIRSLQARRYDAWEWNFGRSTECTIRKRARFEGVGSIEAYISLEHGLIRTVAFRGDYFSLHDPDGLSALLAGRKLDRESVEEVLGGVEVSTFFSGLEAACLTDLLLA